MDKLIKLGYEVEEYSRYEGAKFKRFISKDGTTIAVINLDKKTISPIWGYYGGHLKRIAKEIGFNLVE